MKKKVVLVAALISALFIVACGANEPQAEDPVPTDPPQATEAPPAVPSGEGGNFTAGTFRGQSRGWGSLPIVLDVTFSDTQITNVSVVSHSETPGLSDLAFSQVPAQIVNYQTLLVDTIAGATLTRMGIINAVIQAADEAGADMASLFVPVLPPVTPGDPITRDVDVVIVGAGGAGMSAALSAIANGANDVLLVERTAAVGGNTLASGNGMTAWNAIMPERLANMGAMGGPAGQRARLNFYLGLDPATFAPGFDQRLISLQAQITEFLEGDDTVQFDSIDFFIVQTYFHSRRTELDGTNIYASYDFVRIMVEESTPALEWIESLGGQFEDSIGEAVGSLWRRGARPVRNNHEDLFAPMLREMERVGGEIMFNTRIEALIYEGGEVRGVTGTMTCGTPVTINAASVILATGGFAANLEMVRAYDNFWGQENLAMVTGTTNVDAAQGDGIRMAQAIGADVYQMGIAQLMQLGFAYDGVLATGHANYSFYVNSDGVRFVNETTARDTVCFAAFEVGGTFFEIRSNINEVWNQLSLVGDGTSRIYTADTIEDLALEVGLDPAVVRESFDRFVGFAQAGLDEDFGRTTFFRRDGELPIETGPWHIRVLRPSTHYTNGGLLVDTSTRVINTSGQPIPNLFAAGEIMSGVHGGNRLGGNAVAEAFAFGKIAGEMAAENAM
jgi:fumarate reductase flavoprotein subunit